MSPKCWVIAGERPRHCPLGRPTRLASYMVAERSHRQAAEGSGPREPLAVVQLSVKLG